MENQLVYKFSIEDALLTLQEAPENTFYSLVLIDADTTRNTSLRQLIRNLKRTESAPKIIYLTSVEISKDIIKQVDIDYNLVKPIRD